MGKEQLHHATYCSKSAKTDCIIKLIGVLTDAGKDGKLQPEETDITQLCRVSPPTCKHSECIPSSCYNLNDLEDIDNVDDGFVIPDVSRERKIIQVCMVLQHDEPLVPYDELTNLNG